MADKPDLPARFRIEDRAPWRTAWREASPLAAPAYYLFDTALAAIAGGIASMVPSLDGGEWFIAAGFLLIGGFAKVVFHRIRGPYRALAAEYGRLSQRYEELESDKLKKKPKPVTLDVSMDCLTMFTRWDQHPTESDIQMHTVGFRDVHITNRHPVNKVSICIGFSQGGILQQVAGNHVVPPQESVTLERLELVTLHLPPYAKETVEKQPMTIYLTDLVSGEVFRTTGTEVMMRRHSFGTGQRKR